MQRKQRVWCRSDVVVVVAPVAASSAADGSGAGVYHVDDTEHVERQDGEQGDDDPEREQGASLSHAERLDVSGTVIEEGARARQDEQHGRKHEKQGPVDDAIRVGKQRHAASAAAVSLSRFDLLSSPGA